MKVSELISALQNIDPEGESDVRRRMVYAARYRRRRRTTEMTDLFVYGAFTSHSDVTLSFGIFRVLPPTFTQ